MRREINNWWIQAERDLLSARNAFKSKDYYVTAFLCQQAVEKSLKALILHMKALKVLKGYIVFKSD